MLDILFTDYDKVAANLYEFYSDLNSKIWEIIDLNLEPINLQIEVDYIFRKDLLGSYFWSKMESISARYSMGNGLKIIYID